MIGTDIIEIARIREAAAKGGFIEGVFTVAERKYYEENGARAETLAGLFAAKEAVVKAIGCGFAGLSYKDIEIYHAESGAPKVRILRGEYMDKRLEISISHCKEYATAVCIVR